MGRFGKEVLSLQEFFEKFVLQSLPILKRTATAHRPKSRKAKGSVLSGRGNNIKKTTENKALPTTPAKPTAQGSTAGSCVSATVGNNILYIHNIERALFHGIPFAMVDFRGGKAGFVRMEL